MIPVAVFGALGVLSVICLAVYLRRTSRDWDLTFEDQATVDTLAAIPRPAELHHEEVTPSAHTQTAWPQARTEGLRVSGRRGQPRKNGRQRAGLVGRGPSAEGLAVPPVAAPPPPERHHDWSTPPAAYRPRHGPTEPTAILPRAPRQHLPPVLPPAYGPAVAVLGVVIAGINSAARDVQRWPELTAGYPHDTAWFGAIMDGGE